jgi:hypothetical protein
MVSVPPDECVNVPAPVVDKFPPTDSDVEPDAVTPAPDTARLLKLFAPLPVSAAFTPLNVTVLLLPEKVPPFVQFPPTV